MNIEKIQLEYGDMIKTFKQILNDNPNYKTIITKCVDKNNEVINNNYEIRIVEETIWNKCVDSWNYENLKQVSCPLDKEKLDIIMRLIKEK